jgi:integrase
VDPQLRLDLERLILDEQPEPNEYLLFPERLGVRMTGGPLEVIWLDKKKPMTSTTLHRWWHRCLERARVSPQPMHEARHTAITELVRRTGNLKVAQQLAGHASITTTADIYTHFDLGDLASALRLMAEED